MLTETYRGRKLKVKKGRDWGTLEVSVNGYVYSRPTGRDEQAAMAQARRDVDFVDRDPVVDGGRWGAEWYAPGTYTLCAEGPHPVALGEQCRHPYCRRERGEQS